MLTIFRLFAICLCFLAGNASAQTRVILLGGGAGPDSSELSIEKNVAWVAEVLRRNGISNVDIQYASGRNSSPDVKGQDQNKPDLNRWLPIARVFSSKLSLMTTYRKNSIANLDQANTRDNVIKLVESHLQALKAGDDLLIIYHGHGGHEPKNTNGNHLRLWGESRLDVSEIIDILNKQPQNTTIRFIFPQCYSGAFTRLIQTHADNNQSIDNISRQRCGYVTVPDDRKSEGCTVENDESKYVDFSTYFFAAITGKTRLDQPLEWNPDKNQDGVVDFREAYFYANLAAYSRDVPRSTSEYFLESWEPWYLRWIPYNLADADNEYKHVVVSLASKLGITSDIKESRFIAIVDEKHAQSVDAFKQKTIQLGEMKKDEKKIRKELKKETLLRWPEFSNAYTGDYPVFVHNNLEQLHQWLLSHSSYQSLVEYQDRIELLEEELLKLDRDIGMHMRLRRAMHMTKLVDSVARFGSHEVIETYHALLKCESWTGMSGK